MWPEACSPASVFTSIGKKVITTTTAALDCQSKPNQITMIGAMPMIGSAETRLPIGSRRVGQELEAIRQDGDHETRAGADDEAGQHRLQDRLVEIGRKDGQRSRDARADRRGRRQQHEGYAAAAGRPPPR